MSKESQKPGATTFYHKMMDKNGRSRSLRPGERFYLFSHADGKSEDCITSTVLCYIGRKDANCFLAASGDGELWTSDGPTWEHRWVMARDSGALGPLHNVPEPGEDTERWAVEILDLIKSISSKLGQAVHEKAF